MLTIMIIFLASLTLILKCYIFLIYVIGNGSYLPKKSSRRAWIKDRKSNREKAKRKIITRKGHRKYAGLNSIIAPLYSLSRGHTIIQIWGSPHINAKEHCG